MASQINAHFLYNTLDSIHWISRIYKVDEISTMILIIQVSQDQLKWRKWLCNRQGKCWTAGELFIDSKSEVPRQIYREHVHRFRYAGSQGSEIRLSAACWECDLSWAWE